MDKHSLGFCGIILVIVGLALTGCSNRESAPAKEQERVPAAGADENRAMTRPAPAAPRPTPPYFPSAEAARPFPRLLPAAFFAKYPLVQRAYQIANDLPGVLAQQPCYCYCNKVGHRSLLDCYASDHGAG